MKNSDNKDALSRLLCKCDMGANILAVGADEDLFSHDKANVTMTSYMLQAFDEGKSIICILSEDTDVFVTIRTLVVEKKMSGHTSRWSDLIAMFWTSATQPRLWVGNVRSCSACMPLLAVTPCHTHMVGGKCLL